MKRVISLLSVAILAINCQRATDSVAMEDNKPIIPNTGNTTMCNVTYNDINAVDPWGVLIRTTCSPSEGEEAPIVVTEPTTNARLLASNNSLPDDLYSSDGLSTFNTEKQKNKAVHFWFYGTDSQKLFKPHVYARVFVFNNDAEGNAKIEAAQAQIRGGRHVLGFDSGPFQGVYPTMVLNIQHKQGKNGKTISSYNFESEVKRSLPVGKKIFIQFIIKSSPTNTYPNDKSYGYAVFLNEDNKAYPHYKIDFSDRALGYQGHNFYYNQ